MTNNTPKLDKKQEAFEKWLGLSGFGKVAQKNLPMVTSAFSHGWDEGKHYTIRFLEGRIKPSKWIK